MLECLTMDTKRKVSTKCIDFLAASQKFQMFLTRKYFMFNPKENDFFRTYLCEKGKKIFVILEIMDQVGYVYILNHFKTPK